MDWLEAVAHYEPIPIEEQHRLIRLWQQNQDVAARNKLVMSNVRYAVKFAKRYMNHQIPLNDLVSECMIGLMKAADNFDFKKKNKKGKSLTFLTYGYWQMLRYTQTSMLIGQVIRKPHNLKSRKNYKPVCLFSEYLDQGQGLIPEHSYLPSDILQIEDEWDYLFSDISDRSREIVLAFVNGSTFQTIGKDHNISGARAHQLFQNTCKKIRETKILVKDK